MCNCESIYLCVGNKKLLKYLETYISEDTFYLKCASCEKYREYHSQNYIICNYCNKCYCKNCNKELIKDIYESIKNRHNYLSRTPL